MVRKVLANEPLKDITMERVRVEEFEKSLCKILGMSQSESSLHFVGIKGIYTGVR